MCLRCHRTLNIPDQGDLQVVCYEFDLPCTKDANNKYSSGDVLSLSGWQLCDYDLHWKLIYGYPLGPFSYTFNFDADSDGWEGWGFDCKLTVADMSGTTAATTTTTTTTTTTAAPSNTGGGSGTSSMKS